MKKIVVKTLEKSLKKMTVKNLEKNDQSFQGKNLEKKILEKILEIFFIFFYLFDRYHWVDKSEQCHHNFEWR